MNTLNPTVICDIDNCISDDAWRIGSINWQKTGEERYDAYHSLAPFDNPRPDLMLEDLMRKTGGMHPRQFRWVFLTARPVSEYVATEYWLRYVAFLKPYALLMRPKGNTMSSPEVKSMQLSWLYQPHLEYGVNPQDIVAAYDDHQGVVDMYAAQGIKATRIAIHNVNAYHNPLTNTVLS